MVRRRAQTGFTLKELAITTAVISALAAISYPFFQRWLIKVHGPTCQGNMKQLSFAITQYALDADGEFPAGVNTSGNGWAGQLYQYTKTTVTYKCPDDPREGSSISYAENQNLVRSSSNKLANPSATIVFYELTTLDCDPSVLETVSATGLDAPQNSIRHSRPQSPFGLNFLLADSHVKYLTPEQVSNGAGAVPPTNKGIYLATFAVQ